MQDFLCNLCTHNILMPLNSMMLMIYYLFELSVQFDHTSKLNKHFNMFLQSIKPNRGEKEHENSCMHEQGRWQIVANNSTNSLNTVLACKALSKHLSKWLSTMPVSGACPQMTVETVIEVVDSPVSRHADMDVDLMISVLVLLIQHFFLQIKHL